MIVYPTSDITIGGFRWNGVTDVRIHKSLHSPVEMAVITLPGKAAVQKGKLNADGTIQLTGTAVREDSTGNLFAAGDAVSIRLGWNGEVHEEFAGFVKRVGRGIPCQIECEGYSYQMRRNIALNGKVAKPTVKSLLEMAVGIRDGNGRRLPKALTDIKVECSVDVPLAEMTFTEANGLQVATEIMKLTDGNLTIFFKSPRVLWCGLLYTPYADGKDPVGAGTVGYRPAWNVVRDGGLRERLNIEPVQVYYGGKYATGTAVWTQSKVKYAERKVKHMLNSLPSVSLLQQMANEKELRMNYVGYEGRLNAFLQPYCQPGYKATIINDLYPDMDGDYMVEEIEVLFGMNGARRIVTVGPRIGVKTL